MNENTPVEELYDKSPVAETAALTFVSKLVIVFAFTWADDEITPSGNIAFTLPLVTVPTVTKLESPTYPVASCKSNAGVASVPFNEIETPPNDIELFDILAPSIWAEPLTTPSPVVLNTLESTATASAATEIPSPAPTFTVNAPLVPPPVKPFPAVTLSISPASFVNENSPVEELYDKSPAALSNPLTSASVLSVKLITPVPLLYERSPFTEIAPLALVFVKKVFVEPSDISSESPVTPLSAIWPEPDTIPVPL